MFEKVSVKGEEATPFYKELTAATGVEPGWNFHKYLLDRQGNVVATFASKVKPDDPALVAQIETLLAVPKPEASSAAAEKMEQEPAPSEQH
jgi:glutathione peroxidase